MLFAMAKISVYLLYLVPLLLEQLVHSAPQISNNLQLDGNEGGKDDLHALVKGNLDPAIAGDDFLNDAFIDDELQRIKRQAATTKSPVTKGGKETGKGSEPNPVTDEGSDDNTMLYVGIAVGVIVVILVLGCVIYCCCCSGGGKKGKSKSKSKKSKKSRKSSKGSSRSKHR